MPVTLLNETLSYDTATLLLPEGRADPCALGTPAALQLLRLATAKRDTYIMS